MYLSGRSSGVATMAFAAVGATMAFAAVGATMAFAAVGDGPGAPASAVLGVVRRG